MTNKPPRKKRGVKGFGTIRFRSDGRWEGRYSDGINPGTGKQNQKSVYGKTQQEVAIKLKRITYEIEQGTYTEPSKLTVAKWLDTWHSDFIGDVKQSTKISYNQHIKNHLKPTFGAIKLSNLKTTTIQKLYNDLLKKGKSPKTIKNIHGVLHKSLSQAVSLGYIKTNPATSCKLPRIEKTEIKPLSSDEMVSFLNAIKDHKLESVYKVALFTGMRLGEITGLTWNRVNFDKGTILIDRQLLRPRTKGDTFKLGPVKNDKPRTITPATYVMDVLRHQKEKQQEEKLIADYLWDNTHDFVFTNSIGKHISYWTLITHLKKILTNLNIEPKRFHDLRHSYAVNALQAGDDVKTVQANLGHHTAAFTLDTYGHVTDEMRRESASRMDAFIQAKTAKKKPVKGQIKGQTIYKLTKKPRFR